MYFFYCLARSPALNTACQTGSSCWWKRTPNLCLNVCNLLCLHACSSPPPPYLTSSINKTAFWVAHSVVWGWQIDDSWFAPRGDAGRDQKIKQNTEIKGWILWEEKRTVVEKKGHNSSVIPLRTPAANAATRGGRLRRFRSDQWTHPEGTKDTYREETLCNLFVCVPVFICVCVYSPLAECATAKKTTITFLSSYWSQRGPDCVRSFALRVTGSEDDWIIFRQKGTYWNVYLQILRGGPRR